MIVETPGSQMGSPAAAEGEGEAREKKFIRQPPIGEGRGKGGDWRGGMQVDVGVDVAQREIKVKRRRGPE